MTPPETVTVLAAHITAGVTALLLGAALWWAARGSVER